LAEGVEIEDAGERFFLDDGGGEGGFVALEGADFFFDGVFGEEAVSDDGFRLTDAVRAVDGLSFGGGVPPRVEEDRVAGGGEVKAEAGGFEREEEDGFGFVGLELLDEFGAVFGGAGEHEVLDAVALKAVADQLEHFDELAENEDLVAFVPELFDAFEEGVEFGAGEVAVRGVDERGVAADLAEAEEAREDVEADGDEVAVVGDAEELGARALEFGVVELALFAFEFDDEVVFRARREIGRGLGLGAAEEEVADAAVEAGERGGVGLSYWRRKDASVPRRPGWAKAKRLQRSVRRFSIGVPVRTKRWGVRRARAAWATWLLGFLMNWPSSRMTASQGWARNQSALRRSWV